MGFYGTIFLVLLVLKLTAVSTLSWLAVFSPLIIGTLVTIIIVALAGLLGVKLHGPK